jgi:UDP-N-acetyl-D-mannosaminuronic acid dehydrogenase
MTIELKRKIENRTAKLAVIGLGYVGLPLASVFAEKGFEVVGVDIKEDTVSQVNKGISPIEGNEPGLQALLKKVTQAGKLYAVNDTEVLTDRDVILIAVETPVNDEHIPVYIALRSALSSLGTILKSGMLIIIESTLAPGTMNEIVRPILEEKSGLEVNKDFYLGYCPERVMPGKLLQNISTMSRVVGGGNPETADVMLDLYRLLTDGDLDPVDWITAELVKTVENTYRDVQIAFANEVALICEVLGGNVWEVRELVNKSPARNLHLPGSGVGGHCIPKDPWLLAYSVMEKGISSNLIPASRKINDSMPIHMKDLVISALEENRIKLTNARILILGFSYLEESDDTRNSPSKVLVDLLREMGAKVTIHDPYVPEYQGDLYEMAKGCQVTVAMVKHREYIKMDLPKLFSAMETPVLIDGRKVFMHQSAIKAGFLYKLLGMSKSSL